MRGNLLSEAPIAIRTCCKLSNVPYSIKVSLNCVKTNFKQKLMFIATKPSQRHIWDLLPDTRTPPEKFLPTPLDTD